MPKFSKDKEKEKAKARKYLQDLLTYEDEAEESIVFKDEPSGENPEFDLDRLANRLPFWIERVSHTTRKPKKLLIDDWGVRLGLVNQGHEAVYKFLIEQNANLYKTKNIDSKKNTCQFEKLKNFKDLGEALKTSFVFQFENENLPGLLDTTIEGAELIDHHKRIEITQALSPLIPKLKSSLDNLDNLPDLTAMSEKVYERLFKNVSLRKIKLSAESKDKQKSLLTLAKYNTGPHSNQCEELELDCDYLANNYPDDEQSKIAAFIYQKTFKKVILRNFSYDSDDVSNNDWAYDILGFITRLRTIESLEFDSMDFRRELPYIAKKSKNINSISIKNVGAMTYNYENDDDEMDDIEDWDLFDILYKYLPGITTLDLRYIEMVVFKQTYSYSFASLEEATFIEMNTMVQALGFLIKHPHLKKLNLTPKNVHVISPSQINNLIDAMPIMELEELILVTSALTTDQLARLLAKCPRLKMLKIRNNNFNLSDLMAVQLPCPLESLSINCARITVDSLYDCLRKFPKLTHLTIKSEIVASYPNVPKVSCPSNLNLKVLQFEDEEASKRKFNPAFIRPILKAAANTLTTLNITLINFIGADTLGGLHLPKLKSLKFDLQMENKNQAEIGGAAMTFKNIVKATQNLKKLYIDCLGEFQNKEKYIILNDWFVYDCKHVFEKLNTLDIRYLVVSSTFLNAVNAISKQLKNLRLGYGYYKNSSIVKSSTFELDSLNINAKSSKDLQHMLAHFQIARNVSLHLFKPEFIDLVPLHLLQTITVTNIGIRPDNLSNFIRSQPDLITLIINQDGDKHSFDFLEETYTQNYVDELKKVFHSSHLFPHIQGYPIPAEERRNTNDDSFLAPKLASTPKPQSLTQRAEHKIDKQTGFSPPSLAAKSYFEDSKVNYDRHDIYTQLVFENGDVRFKKYEFDWTKAIPVHVPQLNTQELIKKYDEMKAHNPNIRLGGDVYDIAPGEWLPLPSCASVENLHFINQSVDIRYDANIRKYYFKLKDHIEIPQKIDLRFIEEIEIYQFTGAKISNELKQFYNNIISQLRFNQAGLIKDINYYTLSKLSKGDLAKAIYCYIKDKFPDEQKDLQGTLNNDVDVLNALLTQCVGACRHRAFLFAALASEFNIPHLSVFNDVHAFAEVFGTLLNGKRVPIQFDLGGYPDSEIKLSKNHLRDEEQKSTEVLKPNSFMKMNSEVGALNEIPRPNPASTSQSSSSTYLEGKQIHEQEDQATTEVLTIEPFAKMQLEVEAQNQVSNSESISSTAQESKKIIAQNEFNSFIQEQVVKASSLEPNKRNILIAIEDDQVDAFHASLLNYYKTKNQRMFYVPNLDAILDRSGYVNEGKIISTASPMASFVQTANPWDALIINWSHYNNLHLGHNSIMDDERKIGATAIPEGVVNIGIIKRSEVNRLGEDLTSRFKIYAQCPNHVLSKPIFEKAPTIDEVIDKETIIPFYNEYWRSKLLGTIGFNDKGADYLNGELINAIQNNKKTLILQNAPWHSEDFKLFMNELLINRRFVVNGDTHFLPDDFTIQQSNEPFKLNLEYVGEIDYKQPPEYSYVLNQHTLASFIQGAEIRNRKLQNFNGILGSYTWFEIDVYVTDNNITRNQWAWLLSEAKRHQCRLKLHVAKNVTLPLELQKSYEDKNRYYEEVMGEPPPPPAPYDMNEGKIKVIETSDLDSLEEYVATELPGANVFSVHMKTTVGEIIGRLAKDPNCDEFSFDFHYSHIYQLLSQGKTVVLKGDLSEKTRQQLESLFTSDPHIYINGYKHYFPGRLVLLTTVPKAIPFLDSKKVNLTQEQKWQQLTKYLSNKVLFDKFYQSVQEFEAATKFQFTYAQFKTMLQKLEKGNYTNPFAPFFRLLPDNKLIAAKKIWERIKPKTIAITADEFLEKRKNKFIKQIKSSPYTFIVGPSGAGKSTFVTDSLADDPARRIFIGVDKMVEWAEAKDGTDKILFLDEANLERPGVWENLEGIFDIPPGVIINNRYYPLSPDHKIVFAGNYNTFKGRFQHDIFSKHGNVITFKDLPNSVLRDRIIMPELARSFPSAPFEHSKITEIFLSFYNRVNVNIATGKPLTPRNIKTMLLRFKLYVDRYQPYFAGGDRWQKMACMAAYDEVATSLTKQERQKLKAALTENDIISTMERKHYKQALKANVTLPEKMVITKSRKNPLRLLKDGLALREMKLNNPTLHDFYAPGLLYEGGSGIGKSTMIIAQLQAMNFVQATPDNIHSPNRYYVLTPGRRDIMLQTLKRAFRERAVIVIDEFNSLGLEKELNTLLSSTKKPGFFIIATQNPITMKKRPQLSEALLKRMQKIDLKDYTEAELLEVAAKLSGDVNFAREAVKNYLDMRKAEDKSDMVFKSTPRTLFDDARRANKSLKRPTPPHDEGSPDMTSKRSKQH